jgi:predicted transcriptional regulator
MTVGGRVVTARLPEVLVAKMDEVASRMGRSKSWIVRQAVGEWLAEEQRRYELTLEALKSVDEGRTIPHEEVLARVWDRTRQRRAARTQSVACELSGPPQHRPTARPDNGCGTI